MKHVDISRKARRAECRARGQQWGGRWLMFDPPNPNGNRHHRRHIVALWKKELKK